MGSSKDIEKRWKQHKSSLKSGKHHSAKLQRAWNKYGKESGFRLEILEECEQANLLFIEQVWYDKLDSYENGYNGTKFANSPHNDLRWDARIKFENEINSLVESLYEFSLRDGVFPEETQVSFFGVSIPKRLDSKGSINKFKRVVDTFTEIIDCGEFIDKDLEYRLQYIEISSDGSRFSFTPDYCLSKNSKYSLHVKHKKGDLYKELLDFIWINMVSLNGGKHVKKCFDKYLNKMSSGE